MIAHNRAFTRRLLPECRLPAARAAFGTLEVPRGHNGKPENRGIPRFVQPHRVPNPLASAESFANCRIVASNSAESSPLPHPETPNAPPKSGSSIGKKPRERRQFPCTGSPRALQDIQPRRISVLRRGEAVRKASLPFPKGGAPNRPLPLSLSPPARERSFGSLRIPPTDVRPEPPLRIASRRDRRSPGQ